MRRSHFTKTEYLALAVLFGGAMLLYGVESHRHWYTLLGAALAAWAAWALERPQLISRRVNWPRRWRRGRRQSAVPGQSSSSQS